MKKIALVLVLVCLMSGCSVDSVVIPDTKKLNVTGVWYNLAMSEKAESNEFAQIYFFGMLNVYKDTFILDPVSILKMDDDQILTMFIDYVGRLPRLMERTTSVSFLAMLYDKNMVLKSDKICETFKGLAEANKVE